MGSLINKSIFSSAYWVNAVVISRRCCGINCVMNKLNFGKIIGYPLINQHFYAPFGKALQGDVFGVRINHECIILIRAIQNSVNAEIRATRGSC